MKTSINQTTPPTATEKWEILKKLFALLMHYKWHMIIGVFFLVLVDSLQLFIPKITQTIIDGLTIETINPKKIYYLGSQIIGIAILVGIFRFGWRYFIAGSSHMIERDLRQRLYKHLQTLSPQFYDNNKIGDIMAYVTNDISAIRMATGFAILAAADAFIMGTVTLCILLTKNWQLTLLVLSPIPLLTITMLKFGKLVHNRFKIVQEKFSKLSERTQESFSGIRVTKAYGDESSEENYFDKQAKECATQNIALAKINGLLDPLVQALALISIAILLLVGGKKVITGTISLGEFVAFAMYINMMIWPMMAIGWVINLTQRGVASMGRLQTLFDTKPDIIDGQITTIPQQPTITVKNLTFCYPKTSQIVLDNISFQLGANQTLGIVGNTGSGKTTLVELLMRLYDPPEHSIFINNQDITKMKIQNLRQLMSYIPQESFLFGMSIADNIAFACDNLNQQQVEKVAQIAHIDKNIKTFPEQYQTIVGERGVTLSGGQKQRIAIARALATKSAILIMDDSLSSVDTETEVTILNNIKQQTKKQSKIIIAHRFSTVMNADKIIVLDKGKLIEEGTHQQLLKNNGHYKELYDLQQLEEQTLQQNKQGENK